MDLKPQKNGARTYITHAELERYVQACSIKPTAGHAVAHFRRFRCYRPTAADQELSRVAIRAPSRAARLGGTAA
jgi:hypothetical protein